MKSPTLLALALALAAALGAIDAVVQAEPTAREHEAAPPAEVALVGLDPADAVVGAGLGERIACVLCVGAFLALGGASVGGAVVVAMTHPEFVAACGLSCALGFS